MTIDAANLQTFRHIERVRDLLNDVIRELLTRGELHDQCKLVSPEAEAFAEVTDKLAACTYGSPEYEGYRKQISAALDHHYARSRHHPEHFPHGVNDMTLVDLIEMFIDWKASSERHANGNILKSIEHNTDRFNLSPQLARIFQNTAEMFDDAK